MVGGENLWWYNEHIKTPYLIDPSHASGKVEVIPLVTVFHHMFPNLRRVSPGDKIFHIPRNKKSRCPSGFRPP